MWRHRLGTDTADDVLVFEEPDQRFYLGVGLTRSEQWIVIDASSNITSETHLIPAYDPTAAPALVRAKEDGHEYHLDHWGDRFVVLTNLDAEDFRVMQAPAGRARRVGAAGAPRARAADHQRRRVRRIGS